MDRTYGLRQRITSRQLAGDSRTGSYARSQARNKHVQYFKRRWPAHLAFTVIGFAIVIAGSFLVPSTYMRGLIVGIGCTAIVAGQWSMVVQITGTGGLLMAELAEQWTAALLRKQRGWQLVNHVNLRIEDIDHVLVGPDGILAVETKWSSYPWTPQRLSEAADQAARNARDLSIWSSLKPFGPAQPLVVLWGPSAADVETPTTVDGVPVVSGDDFAQWWARKPARAVPLNASDVEDVVQILAERCAQADPYQPDKPLSAADVAILTAASLGSGMLGFLAVLLPLVHLNPVAGSALSVLAAAAGFVALKRLNYPYRYVATAWTTGVTAALAALVMTLLLY